VWLFLRKFELPYLSLYDHGYTSLGEKHNTIKNPYLRFEKDDQEMFHPAFMLTDGEKERDSRANFPIKVDEVKQ
jgi:FAD synthetase